MSHSSFRLTFRRREAHALATLVGWEGYQEFRIKYLQPCLFRLTQCRSFDIPRDLARNLALRTMAS